MKTKYLLIYLCSFFFVAHINTIRVGKRVLFHCFTLQTHAKVAWLLGGCSCCSVVNWGDWVETTMLEVGSSHGPHKVAWWPTGLEFDTCAQLCVL